jgi:hypothetical protein
VGGGLVALGRPFTISSDPTVRVLSHWRRSSRQAPIYCVSQKKINGFYGLQIFCSASDVFEIALEEGQIPVIGQLKVYPMKIPAIAVAVCLYVVLYTSSFAQDNQQPALLVNPNDVGTLQNSINLFTGQAGFPMTLASLPGRGGLNPQLTILYNSAGVKQQVGTWNRDAPTGPVGLGWYLDFSHIVADHQNTGTRHDDTFYLVESGSLNKLVCTDADQHTPKKHYRTYVLETHQPWIILYYYEDEKWVITKDNGYKSVFGDNKRSRDDGTVQYMVRWGNWIGDSNVQTGQLPLAYAWNLSTVENLWSDKLTYYYTNIEERVGSPTGKYLHTRASALKKIVGPTGNSIELKYQNKLCEQCSAPYAFRNQVPKREYQDPHVEAEEPDAYQEKYESRYLSSVATYNEKKVLLYTVNLDYDFIYGNETDGEFYKRLLTKIQKTNANGEQVPATVFSYYRDGDAKGYLSQVDNSIGGVISYNYQLKSNILGSFVFSGGKYTIPGASPKPLNGLSKRDLTIKPPAPKAGKSIGFADLQVGSDYVVVIWRELNYAFSLYGAEGYMYIYQWEGEWVEYNMGSIGAYDVSDDLNRFKALFTLQHDFFALVKRSENSDGSAGDCSRKDLFVFRKTRTGWEKAKFANIDLPYYYFHKKCDEGYWTPETFLLSGNGYIALGSRASRGFTTYTWNGSIWVMEDHETSYTAIDNAISGENNYIIYHNNDENPDGKDLTTLWYLTEDKEWVRKVFPASVRFASGKAKRDADGTDRSFWYNAPALSLCMADDNPEYAYLWDDDYNITKRIELFTTYKESGPVFLSDKGQALCYVGYIGAFNGSNFVTTPSSGKGFVDKSFFTQQGVVYGSNFLGWSIYTEFDPNTNTWRGDFSKTPLFAGLSNARLVNGDIRYREPDGSWLNIAQFSAQGRLGSDVNTVGPNTFTESIPLNLATSNIRGSTIIHYLKNGRDQAYTIPYLMDGIVHHWEDGWKDKHFGGYNIYIAFDRSNPTKEKSKALYLFRMSDDKITGGHESLVVSSITVNDGYLDFKKSFSYNTASAVMAANGAYPTFNQVDVINGSLDPAKRPRGYTRHYYYNRKDLKNGKYSNVPEAQDKMLGGQLVGAPYLTEVYDDVGTKLQSTVTLYSRYENNIFRNTATGLEWIGISSFLRPVKTIGTTYYPDHTTFTNYGITAYDAKTGPGFEHRAA